jgi:ribonuclease BN (tRNA processing enzyme)
VHDAQYLPEEMEFRRGYGHSDWQTVVKLAKEARVQRLILTHHDPDRTDHQVEAMVNQARYEAGALLSVEAAFEGLTIRL